MAAMRAGRGAGWMLAIVLPVALGACGGAGVRTAAPTLGQPAGIFGHDGQGLGQVRPTVVFNGGDPTGLVRGIRWSSWGGDRAIGDGVGWVPGAESVAQGYQENATIVAFNLGRCGGRLMYRAVEWYFPGLGQKFQPHQYEDICKGEYVGT